MTAGEIDSGILHRHFVAIATSTYEDHHLRHLPEVHEDVRALTDWLCSEKLGGRAFTQQHPALADSPTRQEIRDALEHPEPSQGWRQSDAAVVYITGHGRHDDQGHWVALRSTRADDLRSTALRTADIVGWLAGTGVEQLLLIIDSCHASHVTGAIARFKKPPPKTWLILASAAQDEEALPGALTGAIRKVLAELRRPTGEQFGLDKYLRVEDFIDAVDQELGEAQRSVLMPGSQQSGFHVCLPNPKYRPPDTTPTRPPRRDLALLKTDMEIHWEPRSRGVTDRDAPGWLFTGRADLMHRLIEAATGAPGAVLVTGRAGSGKSAALARLVTLSDPDFRQEYADRLALIPANLLPPEEAVNVAVLATGKNATGIMTQVCRATGALEETGPEPSLDDARNAWKDRLRQSGKRITIVIDALDEAIAPIDVLTQVLGDLEGTEYGERRVRLIVGVRSAGGTDQSPGASPAHAWERPLADRVQSDLRIDPAEGLIQVDEAPWWVHEDLIGYITGLLRLPLTSPYREEANAARTVAEVVADAAGRSFLFAQMAARQLADRRELVNISDPVWRESISRGVFGLFREDLQRTLPDPELQVRAVHLLRAVAFAFGPGLPWRGIWPFVADAVADAEGSYSDRDIAWLLNTRLGGYLVTDRADGVTVYRLFHDDLRNILHERWEELLAR